MSIETGQLQVLGRHWAGRPLTPSSEGRVGGPRRRESSRIPRLSCLRTVLTFYNRTWPDLAGLGRTREGGSLQLEHLLESEEDNEIEILPNGEDPRCGRKRPGGTGFQEAAHDARRPRRGVRGEEQAGMNLARIRRDIAVAQQYFDYVEDRATAAGGLMALIALQTSRRGGRDPARGARLGFCSSWRAAPGVES